MTNNMEISFEQSDDPQVLQTNTSVYLEYSRDPCRTPFQWDDSANAGFSTIIGETWLPIRENFRTVNLEEQKVNEASTFKLYQRMIELRKQYKVLQIGGFDSKVLSENVLGFVRTLKDHNTIAVIINLGGPIKVNLTQLMEGELDESKMKASVILTDNTSSLFRDFITNLEEIEFGEYDAVVFEVSSASRLTISLALIIYIFTKLIL